MNRRSALAALHGGALLFGLTGVFGKLASASPGVIVFGRALFAVLSSPASRARPGAPWDPRNGCAWRSAACSWPATG